jgi:hypothetical protein
MKQLVNNLQRCTRCRIFKPLDEFRRLHTSKSGRTSRCARCLGHVQKERVRRRRQRQQKTIRSPSAPLSQGDKEQALARGYLVCTCCQQERPISEFFSGASASLGKRVLRQCRSCRIELARQSAIHYPDIKRAYLRKYTCKRLGITLAEFGTMMLQQNGRCAICHRPLGDEYQAIDHDHESGKVRGIVHRHCNSVLGFAHDDPLVLFNAADYLLRHHPQKVWHIMRQVFVPNMDLIHSNPRRTPCPNLA